MKIKKFKKGRSSSSKILARYRNTYNDLSAIEIHSISRVETKSFLALQNISTYCPVLHNEAMSPSELHLNSNIFSEDTSNQWQLPLSHGESNAIVLSSSTPVKQPEKEDKDLYNSEKSLDQSTNNKVDTAFSCMLEDLIVSTDSLKLACVEISIDQEVCNRNVSQNGSYTPEHISAVDSNYNSTTVPNVDTVASNSGEIDPLEENHSIAGPNFVAKSDYTTIDRYINESDITKEVNSTQDPVIDQISSPTQEKNILEEVSSIEEYAKNHLILSYEQIVPDDSDPDFYCRVCKRHSKDKASFYKHLTKHHQMILRPFSDWRVWDVVADTNEEAPKSYCGKCEKTFAENRAYLDHFSNTMFHKIDEKGIDIYKSTYYKCDKCFKTRKGLFSIYRHYSKVHKVSLVITEYSRRQSLDDNKENPENQKPINKRDKNNLKLSKNITKKYLLRSDSKIKDNVNTTKRYITKKDPQPEPINETRVKHLLTTENNARRSTRIHNTKARTNSEPTKRCKPKIQTSTATKNIKPFAKVTINAASLKLAKIDRRICQFCNKILSTARICKDHIERKHKKLSTSKIVEPVSNLPERKDTDLECVICGQLYISKILLYTHFKNNHKTEATSKVCTVNKFYCELCDRKFKSSKFLQNHMKKIHRLIKDKNLYAKCYCAVCNVTFKGTHGYNCHAVSRRHIRNTLALKKTIADLSKDLPVPTEETSTEAKEENNTPLSENLLIRDHCNACNITFFNKSSSLMHFFKIHKFSYTEVPGKEVFTRKPNLNMLSKNKLLPKENDPNFYCNVCRKKFNNEGNFKLHLVSIHEMVLKKDRSKPIENNASDKESIGGNSGLSCNVCNRKFISSKSSQDHFLRFHRIEKRKTSVTFSNNKATKRSRAAKII